MTMQEPASPGRSLVAGERLGPYEIVGQLGAGGMGEVYRARDSRLRRDVAVKVLHPYLSMTPEHVQRLAREARAAGSLNHPNIVAVFDVGAEGSVPYVVTELLEGESLRSRLNRGAIPYRKALDYGIQMAQALGAAHEQGVWHRDVKPGNAFITHDGRVKLLDFGLVKLRAPGGLGSQDSTADATQPGGIHGTIGYMSPEQALGEAVDHRTDLFALGVVLYEMFTGVPPFRRGTGIETTRAVLNEDPDDLLKVNPSLPPAASAVVQRCLEKNREQRFQSARDLAFHLQQLRDTSAFQTAYPTQLTQRRRFIRTAVGAGILALLAAALAASLLPRPVPSFEQLTFRRARIGGARFASEERGVVYSEARAGRPPDVWLLSRLDSPESLRLDYARADDRRGQGADVLAVHGNRVALSLAPRFIVGERFAGMAAEAPIGGAAHEVADHVEDADWDPAGKQLVVARSLVGGKSSLEYPPGNVIYSSLDSIRWPRFSPDGRRIAFLEDPTGRGAGGRVIVVDLERKAMPLTGIWDSARGLAWSPAGDEIWFAAGLYRTNRALRAVNLKGRERVILQAPASLTLWDIARDGRLLVSRDEERSALMGIPPGETAERDLSLFDTSLLADLSYDGQKLLFGDRFGVYVRSTDGSGAPERVALKNGFVDAFSPDGERILATIAGGKQLVILPAGAGEPVPLPQHGSVTHRGAMWFPDGRRILFNGGPDVRSYEQSLDGGPPRALTPKNTWTTAISPDGEWLATVQDQDAPEDQSGKRMPIELWPVAGGNPRSVRSSRPGDRPVAWSDDGRWLWVFRRGEVPAEVSRLEIDTGRRQVWKKLTPPDMSGVYSITDFKVTRDGRAYFYSYKRQLSHLYLVSGLN
jgi:serine/threonine protein kinase/Tol biopolymer transport system component